MSVAIVWFRRDLRLSDNPALAEALANHETVVPVFIDAPEEEAPWNPGAASRWWLGQSLTALDAQLRTLGSQLFVHKGESLSRLLSLVEATGAEAVYWNRLYEPAVIARDTRIKTDLRQRGIAAWSGNAALLFEPWTIQTQAGKPYRVFGAFWKACRRSLTGTSLLQAPTTMPAPPASLSGCTQEKLRGTSSEPWHHELSQAWKPGELHAQKMLEQFVTDTLKEYPEGRDVPARPLTSRLSPALHFGEIGPRQVLAVSQSIAAASHDLEQPAEHYLRQLVWREFTHHVLYHFESLPERPLDLRFERFPWRTGYEPLLRAWQQGRTGVPIVDAGMRELWQTGWMHNRVRMIAGSYLTKNLRVPWQLGQDWFWDTLVDADLANNAFGWQWIAGCGADAAPYFRIFNPVRQGERFDADARYVRRWVPEVANLPDRLIHAPWACPESALDDAGVQLGVTYPRPLVNLDETRKEALDAYASIKFAA